MYCCNCGKKIDDNDKFCEYCGSPVCWDEPAAVIPGDGEHVSASEASDFSESGAVPVSAPAASAGDTSEPAGTVPEGTDSVTGDTIPNLEKKIMKNMEDELILEMPEAAGTGQFYAGTYGAGQRAASGHGEQAPYGQGSQTPPPYGQSGQAPHPYGQAHPPYGGGEQDPKEGKNPAKNKKKKVLIITLSCAAAALIIALAVFAFVISSPVNKLKKAIGDRDWTTVEALYEKSFLGDEKKEAKADEILQKEVESLKSEFTSGAMDYSTVKRHLKAIDEFWDDECVDKALEDIRELKDSRDAFESAEQCMQREEYDAAIRLYGEVVKSDSNYEKAQENLETAKAKYREKSLSDAAAYEEIKDYDSAIKTVEEALKLLPGDGELTSRLEALEAAKVSYAVQETLDEAQRYASQKSYFEAMAAIKEGLYENPDDEKLTAALKDYSEKYKADVLEKAQTALGTDENYEAAILVLDSAIRTLNGEYADVEQVFREKREEYVQAQLEKSERENAQAAIVGVWHATLVSVDGYEMGIDEFLEYAGMSGMSMILNCQASGALHVELLGEIGDGTWEKIGQDGSQYNLIVDGDPQPVTINTSGKLQMDLDGVVLIFEKERAA